MNFFGRTGKILFINLSNQTSSIKDIDEYLDCIGGRGINQRILFDSVSSENNPFDPQNPILFGSGPFVGTMVPGANRLAVDFKNVINCGIGSANCGSQFAAEMKYAGYDHIVVTGQSEKPVYLFISNEKVFFREASDLWGFDTWETENQIRRKEKDDRIKTLCIGPAGENLVKFSMIVSDKGRAAGYGGSGALFGSKKLKAIAIRGTLPLTVAYPDKLFEKVIKFNRSVIDKSKAVQLHRKGGTLLPYLNPGENRPHGVRNMSDGFWPNDKIMKISRDNIDQKYTIRKHSCFNCPMYCSHIYEINGKRFEGFQANSFRSFASNVDCTSLPDVLNAHALTNLYGLDGDHTSNVIAWAIECYENGMLTKKDTDGLELTWGNGKAITELVKNIAHRKGFGDILANGIYEAMNKIGRNSSQYAVLVKKNALMEAAMRSHKAWALGILTSAKGGGHLRGAPIQEQQNLSPAVSKALFDLDDISSPTSYKNKAALVIWQENYKAILDCLGLCALMSMWMDVKVYQWEDIIEFYYLVTGEEIDVDTFQKIGSKINNLERIFNLIHAGFDRKDDLPPRKLSEIPVSRGKYQGERLEINQWNKLLDEYYHLHGWDIKNGIPTRETLVDLGLTDTIKTLEEKNLI